MKSARYFDSKHDVEVELIDIARREAAECPKCGSHDLTEITGDMDPSTGYLSCGLKCNECQTIFED